MSFTYVNYYVFHHFFDRFSNLFILTTISITIYNTCGCTKTSIYAQYYNKCYVFDLMLCTPLSCDRHNYALQGTEGRYVVLVCYQWLCLWSYVWDLLDLLMLCGDIHSNPGPRFSLCHTNVQSLAPSGTGSHVADRANFKLDEIETTLVNTHKFDFIGISETWLDNTILDESIKIPGYTLMRKDRICARRSGGVCCYVKDNLPFLRRIDLERNDTELLWVELKIKPKSIIIGVCYRPPGQSRDQVNSFISSLQSQIEQVCSMNLNSVYLIGDFNDRCQDWNDNHVHSELKLELVELVNMSNMSQMISEPTHFTQTSHNLLDIIITDSPHLISDSGTLPPMGTSRHSIIFCRTSNISSTKPKYYRDFWDYSRADFDGLNIAMSDIPWEAIEDEDISIMTSKWTQLFLDTAKEYIPHKRVLVNPRDKPWITYSVKTEIKRRNNLYRRWKRSQRNHDFIVYSEAGFKVKTSIETAKADYNNKIAEKLSSPTISNKQYWNLAKETYGTKHRDTVPPLVSNNQIHSDTCDKANILGQYFASLSQAPVIPSDHILPDASTPDHTLTTWIVNESDVVLELQRLNPKKSLGPDGISGQLLKGTARTTASVLTRIFNKSLSSVTFPQPWKLSHVTPIYKKGNRQDSTNYRPVSLLNIVSKVFEKNIFKRLYQHCINHNLLTPKNSGFRKKDGTINQLIFLVHNIHEAMDANKDVCMVFLDQSRAFDRIWHKGLLLKLRNIGLSRNFISWFDSYLRGRQIQVVLDGHKSEVHDISAGVPQGSILGPLLFLIYINDIVKDIECNISLYADDTCLYIDLDDFNRPTKLAMLNRDLGRLYAWSQQWFMEFNPLKTKYMRFSRNNNTPDNIEISLNNTQLEEIQVHKHLGLYLTPKLNFETHIDNIISKCSRWIALIWKIQRKYPRFCLENVYTSYIRPILEYGHIVYDNITDHNIRRLEAIQRKAAIACTGAYVNTSHERLLRELNWPTLQARREYAKLVVLYKIVNGHVPPYLRSILPPLRHVVNPNTLRNQQDLSLPPVRLQSFKSSFIPSTVKKWNSLPTDIKNSPSISIFKSRLKQIMFPQTKQKEYSAGCGTGSIHLARIRMNMSGLNKHLFLCGIIDTDRCACNSAVEDPDHFFWVCPRHEYHRLTMIEKLVQLNVIPNTMIPTNKCDRKIITNIIVHGDIKLCATDNRTIFNIVESFIVKSKRFT